MNAESIEQLRVGAAVKEAVEALSVVQVEGDQLERRMLVAASFTGALSHQLPEYEVQSVVTDKGELQVTGRRAEQDAADESYLLTISLLLPQRLRSQVTGSDAP